MKFRWWWVCLFAFFSNAGNVSAQPQAPLTPSAIDAPVVEHYQLSFEIDLKRHSLSGQANITLKNSSTHSLSVVPVLLYRLMELEAASDANGKSLAFTQRVVKFPDEPAWQANAIEVTLSAPLAPSQSTTVRLKYGGPLFGYREVMAYVKDTISEDYSLLRAESLPYPMIAAPTYAGWRSSYQNKFDYLIEATVPAGYVAVCSANQIGQSQSEAGKTTWHCAGPPDSNSINVAIARFRVLDDSVRRLRVYVLEPDVDAGTRVMDDMRRALDFFTAYFGPPPKIGSMGARNGLTVIEIPDGWGSYALRGYIFQTAAAFKDPKNAGELYHEVGHVWNAMIADRIQRSRYFDEAFASYFQALAVRQFAGEQAYLALLNSYREIYIQRVGREPLGKTTPIVDYGKQEIGVFSYSKGAWSLYVLHQIVGDDQFKDIVRTFLKEFGEKPADFKNFQEIAERVSQRNLGRFFDEWIYGAASSQMLLDKMAVTEIVKRY